jgi:hypothetical protein
MRVECGSSDGLGAGGRSAKSWKEEGAKQGNHGGCGERARNRETGVMSGFHFSPPWHVHALSTLKSDRL